MADLLDSLCFCDSVRQTPVHHLVLFAGLLYLQGHIFHMDVLPPHRWSQHRLFEIFEASAQDDTLQGQEDAELTPDWFDNFKILIFSKLIHLIYAIFFQKKSHHKFLSLKFKHQILCPWPKTIFNHRQKFLHLLLFSSSLYPLLDPLRCSFFILCLLTPCGKYWCVLT